MVQNNGILSKIAPRMQRVLQRCYLKTISKDFQKHYKKVRFLVLLKIICGDEIIRLMSSDEEAFGNTPSELSLVCIFNDP